MCKKLFYLMFLILLAVPAGNASAAVEIDDFESYTDTADMRTIWDTYETWDTTIFDRYLETTEGAGNSQAMRIDSSYDGGSDGFGGLVKRTLANADWSTENGIGFWQKTSVSGGLSINKVIYRVWFRETNGDLWRTDGTIAVDDATYGGGTRGGYVFLPFVSGTTWTWQDYGGTGGANDDGIMQLDSIDEFKISVFAWSTTSGHSYSMWIDDFEAIEGPGTTTGILSGRVHQIDDFNAYPDTTALQDALAWEWIYTSTSGASIANYLEAGTNNVMRIEFSFPAGSTDAWGVVGEPTIWNWEGRSGILFWVKADTTGDTPQYYHVRFHEADKSNNWGDKWRSPWMPISDLDSSGRYVFIPFSRFVDYGGSGGPKDDNVMQLDEIGNFYVGPGFIGTALNGGTTTLWVDDIVAIDPRNTALAWDPIPDNIAAGISPSIVLSWLPGDNAVSHDVYFGTTNPPPFVRNQTATTYDPGTLADGTLYYWRIDEVDVSNPDSPWTGEVWNFTTSKYNEITFFISSDTHYGRGFWPLFQDKKVVNDLNTLPGKAYPSSIGGTVDRPWGMLVLGDLTDNWAVTSEWNAFVNDYGVFNGKGSINFPVYEAFGNHDIPNLDVVKDGIINRNPVRAANVNISSNGLHYSWDWDSVHFVNANIYPGGAGTEAEDSLTFLDDDLAANVGDSFRPVVIYFHFGFVTTRWSDDQKEAFYNVIKDYNVIAIFHGHSHITHAGTWNGIDVYDPGSTGLDSKSFVVRISDVDDTLTVVARTNGAWNLTDGPWEKSISFGDVDATPPANPINLAATAGDAQVSLNWIDNTETDLAGYNVYRSETQGDLYTKINTSLVLTSDYVDSTATNDTTYYYVVTAMDNSPNESDYSNEASATPTASSVIYDVANSDIAVSGTVSGSYTDTQSSNNVNESIKEVSITSGRRSTRTSYLEHKWTINVTGGSTVIFYVEAYHTANSENDNFVFAYSTDNSSYTDMLTVIKTSDDNTPESYMLPGNTSGTVYIRVRDTDQTSDNTVADTIYIDDMYIRSE